MNSAQARAAIIRRSGITSGEFAMWRDCTCAVETLRDISARIAAPVIAFLPADGRYNVRALLCAYGADPRSARMIARQWGELAARSGRDARRLKVAATDELARRHSYAQARAIAADDGLPYSPRWHRLYLASQPVLGYQTGAK